MTPGVLIFIFCVSNALRGAGGNVFDEEWYQSVLDREECVKQLDALSTSKLGLIFIDSSAKIPSGTCGGNVNDLGDYFQCLAINEIVDDMAIQGKYCTIHIPLNQIPSIPDIPTWPEIPTLPNITWPFAPFPNSTTEATTKLLKSLESHFRDTDANNILLPRAIPITYLARKVSTYAVCVPKVCSPTQALHYVQEKLPSVKFDFREFYCRLPNDKRFSTADYLATAVFVLLAAVTVASTTYDMYNTFIYKREPKKLFQTFSIYTNTHRLVRRRPQPGMMDCVDGIRAISMLWVVIGHSYLFTLTGFIHNPGEALEWSRKFTSTLINSAPITVDTFFTLSGALCVYTTVGKMTKDRFLSNIHKFYIYRLLRIFPLLATMVLLQASLVNHIADGPFWNNVAVQTQNCRDYWWSALLHVQNYVNYSNICLVQTWYLSVDFQLYFIGPLVMIWLFNTKWSAWCALTSAMLISLVFSTWYSFRYEFSAALINPERLREFNDYMKIYYINTLARAPPFFVGMIYGYILLLWKDKIILIPKVQVCILWASALLMMTFCIVSIYPVMQLDHDFQLFDNFLNAYMRAIWALGLGWVMLACAHGYGGPVNWFLSLHMWKLPARLSFCMYLVHVSVMLVSTATWTKSYYFSSGANMYRFMSDVSTTFMLSFILCVLVDAPSSTLLQLILSKEKQKQQTEMRQNENIENNNIVENGLHVKTSL